MIRRLIVLALALTFISACSAFDKDPTPYEGFPERDIPFNPFLAVGPYEGIYDGSMALEQLNESCPSVLEEVGQEIPVELDVIQAGEVISVEFEDGTEENGKLVEDKVTLVKRNADDVRMFHLDFSGEGMLEGEIEVFSSSGGKAMVESCATYSVSCVKSSE